MSFGRAVQIGFARDEACASQAGSENPDESCLFDEGTDLLDFDFSLSGITNGVFNVNHV